MALFDGLFLYEIVLLALGVVLFCAAIFAIIYQVLQKESLGAVLPGLILFSIVMIAYPSVKSVQYKDGLITVEKETREIQKRPDDPKVRKQLRESVEEVSGRVGAAANDPGKIAAVASAEYALGNDAAAKAGLQKALTLDSKDPKALALKERIEAVDRIVKLNAQPKNPATSAQLKESVSSAAKFQIANPGALMSLAEAQNSLGEHKQALENLNKVISIQPEMKGASRMKTEILMNSVR